MTFDQYQAAAAKTAVYPAVYNVTYPVMGLCGEAGEVANKVKKELRGDGDLEGVAKELGDVLWYLAAIASDLEMSLDEIAAENIEKLRSRQERGVLGGCGDSR